MAHAPEHPPLRWQAVWVVAARIVGILATLAANVLAARWLGPAEFGNYLLITTVMALGSLLAMAGLNQAGLRFVSESLALERSALARAYLRRVLAVTAIASLTAAVVVTGAVGLVQAATGRFSATLLLLAISGTGVMALAWQQITAELLRGYGNLRLASLFSGGQTGGPLSNLAFLAGLAVTAVALPRINSVIAAGITVVSVGITVPLALVGLWSTSGAVDLTAADKSVPLSPAQGRELLAVGGTLLLNQILAFASQQFDIWLGAALLSPVDLGLYGAAKRSLLLAAMPVQMAMLTVLSTIPWLHAQRRTQELERVVRGAATLAAIPSLAALALLALFPDPILRLVFTGSYVGAAPTVLVLILGHLVLVLSGNPSHVLAITGRQHIVVAINLAAAAVLIVVGLVGARLYGAAGLAAGCAASLALQNGLLWWQARQQLGVWTHVGPVPWSVSGQSESIETTTCN